MVSPAVSSVRDGPLVGDRWRGLSVALVVAAAAALVALGIAFHRGRRPTAFDTSLVRQLSGDIGHGLARVMLALTDPRLTTSLCVAIAVVALLLRRWNAAAFTAIAPVVAILLTEMVLKPLVARRMSYEFGSRVYIVPGGYAFPSGHQTGLTSLTAECAVLVLRARISLAGRAAAVFGLFAWTVVGALGLVRNYYHYATDTVGAVCVSIACVVGVALLVDSVGPALEARRRSR